MQYLKENRPREATGVRERVFLIAAIRASQSSVETAASSYFSSLSQRVRFRAPIRAVMSAASWNIVARRRSSPKKVFSTPRDPSKAFQAMAIKKLVRWMTTASSRNRRIPMVLAEKGSESVGSEPMRSITASFSQ